MDKFARALTLLITVVLLMSATLGTANAQTANGKYDTDGDGLIEISNLEQLDAIRYDKGGDGVAEDESSYAELYAAAFPVSGSETVCNECNGYELSRSLDFDQADSYATAVVNTEWTTGRGWKPIQNVSRTRAFNTIFDGNGHTISNLYINRTDVVVGLFGYAERSSAIREIGLVDADVTGRRQVGGLVGLSLGTVSVSYVTGSVSGNDSGVGGLVGSNVGTIIDSYTTASVAGILESSRSVGGLVGNSTGTITASHATGAVSAGFEVGGLAGTNGGTITGSYATGSVSSEYREGGGLIGVNGGTITGSYATGSVSGPSNAGNMGGLVGRHAGGDIIASYATGNVTGQTNLGGLAGQAYNGSFVNVYATGAVSGTGAQIGGLVGLIDEVSITNSYATGAVSGMHRLGGLVGIAIDEAAIVSSYATGAVSGGTEVGGLVGENRVMIRASYATGSVAGERNVGGLVGFNSGTISNSYWDTQRSGHDSGVGSEESAGVEGKTTDELQGPTGYTGIYSGWSADLDNADEDDNAATGADDFWDFGTDGQYPVLRVDFNGDGTVTWQEFGKQRLNSPPEFLSEETGARSVAENTAAGENIGVSVAATDVDDDALTYTLNRAGAAFFGIEESSGQLRTKAPLDFETEPSFSVVVSVHDGKDANHNTDATTDATITVTVTVTNVDEEGGVTLPSGQPQVGIELTATLTDPDGSVSETTWEWESSSDGSTGWAVIEGATSNSHTPSDADAGNYLRATASYTDGHGAGKTAQAVTENVVNSAPEFPVGETGARIVAENMAAGENIGSPVAATDSENDALTYTLGGADAESFDIEESSGQLKTRAALDFETQPSYTVEVTAVDPSGTGATTTVTITVTDEDGKVTLPSAQPQIGIELRATLTDPDGSVSDTTWEWESSSDGSTGWAVIEGATSDTYTPAAADSEKHLRVTVSYTDGHGTSKTAQAVFGDAVNSVPEFSARETGGRSVAENTATGENIGTPVAATDADNDTLTYTLGGADAGSFDIDESSGQLKTKVALDFETQPSYTVEVTAADPSGTGTGVTVTVAVTNVDEDGTVTLPSTQPQVGIELRATLTDPDGSVSGTTWEWESSSDGSTGWAVIEGATSDAYTPAVVDSDKHLRVTASYTDGHGTGKTAQSPDTSVPILAMARPEPTATVPPEPTATVPPEPTATVPPEPTATVPPEPTATPEPTAPSTAASEATSAATSSPSSAPTSALTSSEADTGGGGAPIWAIVVIVIGVVGLAGGVFLVIRIRNR